MLVIFTEVPPKHVATVQLSIFQISLYLRGGTSKQSGGGVRTEELEMVICVDCFVVLFVSGDVNFVLCDVVMVAEPVGVLVVDVGVVMVGDLQSQLCGVAIHFSLQTILKHNSLTAPLVISPFG